MICCRARSASGDCDLPQSHPNPRLPRPQRRARCLFIRVDGAVWERRQRWLTNESRVFGESWIFCLVAVYKQGNCRVREETTTGIQGWTTPFNKSPLRSRGLSSMSTSRRLLSRIRWRCNSAMPAIPPGVLVKSRYPSLQFQREVTRRIESKMVETLNKDGKSKG